MPTLLKNLAALLLTLALLAGCGSTKPPLVVPPVQIPPPAPELMTPIEPSPVNVQQLLFDWTDTLKRWQARQRLCRDTPAKCA